MSLQASCPGCSVGKHDEHKADWNIQSGLIRGSYCDCDGNCALRFVNITALIDEAINPDFVIAKSNISERSTHWIGIEPALYALYKKMRSTPHGLFFEHLASDGLNIELMQELDGHISFRFVSPKTGLVLTAKFDMLTLEAHKRLLGDTDGQ